MELLDRIYSQFEGNEMLEDYCDRHSIKSAGILTVKDDERAALVTDHLRDRIAGKVVIEVGAGIGLLALHMSHVAKRVVAIEANPMWSFVFMSMWLAKKPANLTFVFGTAEEAAESGIRGDVALFCTHSARDAMHTVASMLAPEVIGVYGEFTAGHELEPLTR